MNAPLEIRLYRLRLEGTTPIDFPKLPGLHLRGGLAERVQSLFHRSSPLVSEGAGDPTPPFAIRARFGPGRYEPGSLLELDLVLMGGAAAYLRPLVANLVDLGRSEGLGEGRHEGQGHFELARIATIGPGESAILFEAGRGTVRLVDQPWRFPVDFLAGGSNGDPEGSGSSSDGYDSEDAFTLAFRSPTLQRKKHAGPRGTTEFLALAVSLMRRLRTVGRLYGDGDPIPEELDRAWFEHARDVEPLDQALAWQEIRHHSSRTEEDRRIMGWTGFSRYRGDPTPVLPLLRVAEMVHIGKDIASGGGEVALLDPPSDLRLESR